MRIDLISLFPEFVAQVAGHGVVGRAGERERMLPFVQPDVIRQVDFEAGVITVDWDADF